MHTLDARSGRGPWSALWLASLAVGLAMGGPAEAQDDDKTPAATLTIRDGFEGPEKVWRQEQPDAAIEIYGQARTDRAAHEGKQSEGFEFKAGIGGGLYYSYALPKIPITDDLAISMFVRSNRSGVMMLARVVLPADVDPDSRKPSFVLVPSTAYEAADRWQKIELSDMIPAVERQARVLRAASKRKVSLEGAYLERLIVNIYGGEGLTTVFLDELTIGPVPAEAAEAHQRQLRGEPIGPRARAIADRPRAADEPLAPLPPGAAERIKFDRNRLFKDGYPWFPTMVRGFDADPTLMRQMGCDVAVVPTDANADYLDTAIRSGLFLIPELAGDSDRPVDPAADPRPVDPDRVLAAAASFPKKDHVVAWAVANNLGEEREVADRKATRQNVRDAVREIRRSRPGGAALTTGTVLGMLPDYARIPENLDLIGIPASHWGTTQGPFELFRYLEQRKLLTARSNPDAILWSEVDVTAPPVYQRMIWGMDRPPEGGIPRVQPEQIRTATYAALAAGFRGLCFRAEGDLAQGPGRMATIEMALLNEEIDILEPILADPDRSVRLLDTYQQDPPAPPPVTFLQMNTAQTRVKPVAELKPYPNIKGAAISTKDRRGTLVMVNDFEQYGQFQPPQMAMNRLKLRIQAANDARPYLISPGGVRPLDSTRVPGGHDVTLDDFGVTAIVLMTTNVDLKDQIEAAVNRVRPYAIALAIEQAELQRAWVAEIDYKLQLDGHVEKHSTDLIAKADELIKSARDALEREDYPVAWEEARRVGRPLRILMRYHFMSCYDAIIKALKDEDLPCGPIRYAEDRKPQPRLIAPIVAAPLASFNTLPQAWIWLGWIKQGRLGKNAVPSGNFNFKTAEEMFDAGWTRAGYQAEDLGQTVKVDLGGPDNLKREEGGGSSVILTVKPREGLKIDQVVPFADHPIAAIRSPAVPVRAGEIYRVSCMVYMSNSAPPGAGGLIIRDNFGGERLQYRTAQGLDKDWFEVVYYRRIPAEGELTVTLGMAGVTGFATFDDFKVEPIVELLDLANRPVTARARPAEAEPAYNPDGTPVAPKVEAKPNRAALRSQAMPIRE